MSPNGRLLAFGDQPAIGTTVDLVVADLLSGSVRVLRHLDGVVVGDPAWSADGTRLLASSNERLTGDLMTDSNVIAIVVESGERLHVTTEPATDGNPDWIDAADTVSDSDGDASPTSR